MTTCPRDLLMSFLVAMDDIKDAPCLKSSDSREWLETDIWELQYRLDRITYHRDNLLRMLRVPSAISNSLSTTRGAPAQSTQPLRKGQATRRNQRASSRSSGVVWDSKLGFELSALLAAVRAALDVLASIVARFFRGYAQHRCSMGDLGKKLQEYSGDEQLLIVIHNHWVQWARDLREYRDELIHRSTIRTKRRTETYSFTLGHLQDEGRVKFEPVTRSVEPAVVVPRKPKREKMTRQHMLVYDDWYRDEGYSVIETYATVTLPDGTEFLMDMERRLDPATATHVSLEEFCSDVSKNLNEFTTAVIGACRARLPLPAIDLPRRKS